MKTLRQLFILTGLMLAGITMQAQIAPVDDNGVAIGGYDVVSYFSGNAQRGFESFSTKHNGVTYYFFTKENRAAFTKAPEKYLPQFDGYCAWGIGAKAAKFPINPESYDIVNGKLYLFYDAPFEGERLNTILNWHAETTELEKAAHANWVKLKNS